jgi:hypothetical protein
MGKHSCSEAEVCPSSSICGQIKLHTNKWKEKKEAEKAEQKRKRDEEVTAKRQVKQKKDRLLHVKRQ